MLKYFLFFIFFTISLWATPSSLVLKDNINVYDNFELLYYKDHTNSLEIQDIASTTFHKKHANKFSFGYLHDTLWFKIELKNSSSKDEFILSLNEHFYEKANFYYYDTSWKKLQNGVFIPLEQRNVQTSKLSFGFKIPPNTSQTFYIELKGKFPYLGNITVSKKEYFFSHQLLSIESFFIFVFGILVIITLFNLFLWLKLGDKIYIYYVGYTFFALLYFINISGLLAYLDLQYYMYKLHFTVGFTILFLNLFSIEYFNTKVHLKYATYLLKFLAFCILIFGIISIFFYTPWNKLITYTVTLSTISLISVALIIFAKGQRYLKYYLFAILLYFVSIIFFTLLLSGVLEYSFFVRYFYLFALAIEIVVFSLMLTDRYNDIKNKQIKTQEQLINLQDNQKKLLEVEVTKQTKKLSNLAFERELLVKEVFHRVKNNFHMINAFLWFESKKDGNKNRFLELQNRIQSMSLIHEYLCNCENLVYIDTKVYLEKMVKTIMQTYHSSNINLKTNIQHINLGFETMMSLGIIVNEVISNSIKHHHNKTEIVLDITCYQKEAQIILKIRDNGDGFDNTKEGFGLKLIKDFAKKLPNAFCSFVNDEGSVFELIFDEEKLYAS